jgi:hypothetical protein
MTYRSSFNSKPTNFKIHAAHEEFTHAQARVCTIPENVDHAVWLPPAARYHQFRGRSLLKEECRPDFLVLIAGNTAQESCYYRLRITSQ